MTAGTGTAMIFISSHTVLEVPSILEDNASRSSAYIP